MGQIIGIDSGIFMYVWDDNPEFYNASAKILGLVEQGHCEGIFAQIGLIEILTGPKKEGLYSLAMSYKNKLLNFPNLSINSLNENIITIASDMRAKYNLKTPDAIHIATAIDAGASKFYTNDKSLKKVKEIKIQTL